MFFAPALQKIFIYNLELFSEQLNSTKQFEQLENLKSEIFKFLTMPIITIIKFESFLRSL